MIQKYLPIVLGLTALVFGQIIEITLGFRLNGPQLCFGLGGALFGLAPIDRLIEGRGQLGIRDVVRLMFGLFWTLSLTVAGLLAGTLLSQPLQVSNLNLANWLFLGIFVGVLAKIVQKVKTVIG